MSVIENSIWAGNRLIQCECRELAAANKVIEVVKKVTSMMVPVKYGPRRAGYPPRLVADATRIRKDWGWSPKYAALETIIEHAWRWERR